jgi:anti-sigma factor RsiW
MTGARRFSVSTPDWGQAHLSLDAIVAYVDDELAPGARARAADHLMSCPECAAEVVAQRQARAALRAAGGPRLPSSLLSSLRAIPIDTELPPPPPGLAVTADGQFVLLRDVPAGLDGPPPRRSRRGRLAGLAFGVLAVGALAASAATSAPTVLGGSAAVPARLSAVPAGNPAPSPTEPAGLDASLRARLDRLPAVFHH